MSASSLHRESTDSLIHTSRVYIMNNRDILILYVGFLCSLQIGIFNIFVSGILDSFCKRDGNDV